MSIGGSNYIVAIAISYKSTVYIFLSGTYFCTCQKHSICSIKTQNRDTLSRVLIADRIVAIKNKRTPHFC